MDDKITLCIKWRGKEFVISDFNTNGTVEQLKEAIQKATGVRPIRQKLLNLKYKGKPAEDGCKLSNLGLKQGFKIMMMGSLEEDIASVDVIDEDMPEVVNDLDIVEEEIAIESAEVYLNKIERRVADYTIKERAPPREGKKLLVLDIDYTLFDHRSSAETGVELMRPHLHSFLTSAYEHYEIVIWSATSMLWIEEKMRLLGVANNPNYKVWFYLDSLAMISVHTPKYGVVNVKPLAVIWRKYPQYSSKNTIMFDDIRRNFLMNPKSGLRIRPFRQAHLNRDTDNELFKLTNYLLKIITCDDFDTLDHRHWERFLRE